jgi:predicted AlkP superfamily pyrophosphatase or phosphodiesterase
MKNKFQLNNIFAILLVLFSSNIVLSQEFKSEYTIIVVIDGPRYTETFGDSSCKYIPNMGKNLVKEGVLYTNFRNNGPTFTISGHTAMTTGVYQSISNAGKKLPDNPSIFQYYIKEKNRDKSDAYVVASKGKLEVLGNTTDKDWWNCYMPMTYCGVNGQSTEYAGDLQTTNKVYELLNGKTPHLMLVNLLAVDSYGHANNWDQYLASLQKCDAIVYNLWQYIQENPKFKDKTTLFITNDHGRHLDGHKDGFVNHGDKCEGCTHISLLAMGPDFKKGVVVTKERELIDISKTIALLMKFNMPSSKGEVMEELFIGK